MEFLSQDEIDQKIAKGELDIVTTNPTHFLSIRNKEQLSGSIATLSGLSEGVVVNQLGGPILVPSSSDIQTLRHLKNRRIVVPSKRNLGGFNTQAYELHLLGTDIAKSAKEIIELKSSHKSVIEYMLAGRAEAAFVRDGIYEQMIKSAQLKAEDVRIIHEMRASNHPYRVSTRLYPEWPVFALPHANQEDVKTILAALLSIKPSTFDLGKSGINGYSLPADYLSIEELARALKLPPYENSGLVTYSDIWEQHKEGIIAVILLFGVLLFFYIKVRCR